MCILNFGTMCNCYRLLNIKPSSNYVNISRPSRIESTFGVAADPLMLNFTFHFPQDVSADKLYQIKRTHGQSP